MPSRDIIVMGASAGGIEALRIVLASLPKDLPAAVLIVLHISPDHRSVLPRILDAVGPLHAAHAEDGTIEAVEDPSHRFALGVLWHPEAGEDLKLFEELVREAAEYRVRRASRSPQGSAAAPRA